jgi:hypothetical protein
VVKFGLLLGVVVVGVAVAYGGWAGEPRSISMLLIGIGVCVLGVLGMILLAVRWLNSPSSEPEPEPKPAVPESEKEKPVKSPGA